MASFFTELKQRRIVQIVVSYAVSGWVALEVVGALVERGVAPDIVYRVGLVLYLGGLTASVVTGWYHGEKGEQRAPPIEVVLLTLIALATGYAGVGTVLRANQATRAAEAIVAAGLNLNRIGVLYFRDLSRADDLGYLADGLTETLIEQLDDVTGLDVIPSSGSSQFRESDLPLDSIARLLSAGILVDGTVEGRGNDVRLNLLLIDGASGTELLRTTLDRPSSDAFALLEGLAEEVGDLLRRALGTEIALRQARLGTESAVAWTGYQRGRRAERDSEDLLSRGDLNGFIEAWQRADSLFSVAESLEPDWVAPTVSRASLARRWGEVASAEDPSEGLEYMELALQHTQSALRKDPRSAAALSEQGLIQYLIWAFGLARDPAGGERAFEAARRSLEQAAQLDPGQGRAWSILSELYSQIPDIVEANLAARRALEADEFLRSAEVVFRRLYTTSYDLEQFREAIQYCEQGAVRFPESPDFAMCRLWLMAAPRGLDPDAAEAWLALERHLALMPDSEQEAARVRGQLVISMILARQELPDSALAVISRSQASPSLDPTRELLGVEALAHLALGDPATAVDRLRTYLTASPEHRSGWRWSSHWWWRDLQADPEFRRLVGG